MGARRKYEIAVRCINCGNRETVQIPNGTPVSEARCSTCGCKKLERQMMAEGRRVQP